MISFAKVDVALWVQYLNRDLGLPVGLKEISLTERDLDAMVEECVTKYPRPTNPVPIDRDNLRIFYGYLLNGDVEGCLVSFKDA